MRVLLACVLLLVGCTNQPDALRLTLSTDRAQVRPDEPIILHARLRAKGGAACLSRSYRYQVQARAEDSGASIPLYESRYAACGMARLPLFIAMVPLYPSIWAGALMDVCDIGARFIVLPDGETRCDDLVISPPAARDIRRLNIADDGRRGGNREHVWTSNGRPWPIGTLRIKVLLSNKHVDPFPAPLFWRPYPDPVSAHVRVKVAEPRA